MLTANNSKGIRVSATQADKQSKYFCPSCGAEMILKQGEKRIWHFSHQTTCTDSWHYEPKTQWHKDWQDKFPLESQEVVISNEFEKHRADVLISNTVIEFQHSNIPYTEFVKRNNFYTSLGYRVIWVFDICEAFSNGKLTGQASTPSGDLCCKWAGQWSDIFVDIDSLRTVDVFLQISSSSNDENNSTELIKIKRACPPNTLILDIKSYCGEEMFISIIENQTTFPMFTKKDLYDILSEERIINQETYYYGCPKSKSHCCFWGYDREETENIGSCINCEFRVPGKDMYCNKRWTDFSLDDDIEITNIYRNKLKQIVRIDIKQNNEIKSLRFEAIIGRSILDLWEELQPQMAIFRNIETEWYVKFTSSPCEHLRKYNNKCYGYLSKDGYAFPESVKINGVREKKWICVYFE